MTATAAAGWEATFFGNGEYFGREKIYQVKIDRQTPSCPNLMAGSYRGDGREKIYFVQYPNLHPPPPFFLFVRPRRSF
jgi:hypothetical protein